MAKQVLLICADQRQAARLQVALLRYGYMVEVASTFRRGLAVIKHRPPTAIMIDETLPDLDSDLLAQVLAASPVGPRLAVVMLPLHTSATSQVIEMLYANTSPPSDARRCVAARHPSGGRP